MILSKLYKNTNLKDYSDAQLWSTITLKETDMLRIPFKVNRCAIEMICIALELKYLENTITRNETLIMNTL